MSTRRPADPPRPHPDGGWYGAVRRIGRDFWIDFVDFKGGAYWRVVYKNGGLRGATVEEVYMWSRLSSGKALPRRPRWYIDFLSKRERTW